jgi:predicted short-subunit dehydrogenase-like oxidoreductase (DUF2520 family)
MTGYLAGVPADDQASLDVLGPFGFIGVGAAGGALARALAARGAWVAAVTARNAASAAVVAASIPQCRALPDAAAVANAVDIIFLAVPDDALAKLDAGLSWRPEQTIVHVSGAQGIEALPHALACGAGVAALHPLMLFARPPLDATAALARLAGCTWALEASDPAVAGRMAALVAALDGHVVRLTGADRVPYHVAAVLISNYVVALLGAAVELWERFGVPPQTALDALIPLLRATVDNLAAFGPVRALTGPIARGDVGTVAAHLAWLNMPPLPPLSALGEEPGERASLLAAYRALAQLAIPLALSQGTLSESAAQALRVALRADS